MLEKRSAGHQRDSRRIRRGGLLAESRGGKHIAHFRGSLRLLHRGGGKLVSLLRSLCAKFRGGRRARRIRRGGKATLRLVAKRHKALFRKPREKRERLGREQIVGGGGRWFGHAYACLRRIGLGRSSD